MPLCCSVLQCVAALRPSLVLKELKGNPALSGNVDDNPGKSWESGRNRICVPRKGFWSRVHVGKCALVMTKCALVMTKCALVMTTCLYARCVAMAESRRGCTPAQQSMHSSNPLACTSHFSAVAAELLISRHAPCHKHLFLVQTFHFRRIPRDYRGNHRNAR